MVTPERSETCPHPPIPPDLRALLVCPLDHGDLDDIEETLVCVVCGRIYPVMDGVPDMIVMPFD